jgi:hypothetical protein
MVKTLQRRPLMKMIRVGLAAFLAIAVCATVPAVAQHDHDHDHGRGHEDWNRRDHRVEHGGHYQRYVVHEDHHHRRIPDEHFRAHFGREHWFRINRPVFVSGHPRFQYDGYWFGFAQPLPPGWRYTDETYVDYVDDNYYLLSPAHPGVRISINIL